MKSRLPALAAVIVFAAAIAGIAVIGGQDGDGDLPKLPFGAGGETAQADMMLAPAFDIEYRLSDVGDLPKEGPAYTFDRPAGVEARIAKLAAALGLDGPVKRVDGGWEVRDADRQLRVEDSTGVPWSYSSVNPDQPVQSQTAIACAMPECPEGMACAQVCPEPPPDARPVRPADLPDEDGARAAAAEIFTAAGAETAGAAITASDGITSWHVAFEPLVDGWPTTGLTMSASVGPKGVIEFASGWLGAADRVGQYPLVGAREALERLKSGFGGGYGGPRPLAEDTDTASDAAMNDGERSAAGNSSTGSASVSSGSATASGSGSSGSAVANSGSNTAIGSTGGGSSSSGGSAGNAEPPVAVEPPPTVDPASPIPAPMPVPVPGKVVRTLTEARLGLVHVPAFDGSGPGHLVPALFFRFEDDPATGPWSGNQAELPVIAVTDKYLEPAGAGNRVDPGMAEPAPGRRGGEACTGAAAASSSDATNENQPLTLEVCGPVSAKVGQSVTFTVVATDPDAPVFEDQCFGGDPEVDFGDGGPQARCTVACDAPIRDRKTAPEAGALKKALTHMYSKAGTYTATFTYRSGSACDRDNPYASTGSVSMTVTVKA